MSELWIKAMNGHVELFYSQPPKGTGNYIHVIEKSDYDEIQVRLKEVVSFKISEHEVQYNILKENYDELESKYRDLEKECSGWEDRASKPVEWCCKLRDENIEKLAGENLALQAKLDKAVEAIQVCLKRDHPSAEAELCGIRGLLAVTLNELKQDNPDLQAKEEK